MRKSEIKKMLMRMDDIPLPAKEKMLPPEALVERSNPVRRERKAFPKFAAVGFAAVALVLAGALLVESIADKGGKSVLPDNDSVLVNDGVSADVSSAPSTSEDNVAFAPAGTDDADFSSAGAIIVDSAITSGLSNNGETEDMPIISSGKYNGYLCTDGPTKSDTDENGYKRLPGRAYLYSMDSPYQRLDMDEFLTRDDALYAVQISYDTQYSEKYIQGIREDLAQATLEYYQKQCAFAKRVLADVLCRYGNEAITIIVDKCIESFSEDYFENTDDKINYMSFIKEGICSNFEGNISENTNFQDFCLNFFGHLQARISELSGFAESEDEFNKWFNEWEEAYVEERIAIRTEFCNKQDASYAYWRETMNRKAETSMDRYLNSLNIHFYEKTVCHTDDAGEVLLTEVYSVAFLTREQIKSLKGGTDYALIVTLVCDEMTKMENDIIYFDDAYMYLTKFSCHI